LVASLLQLAGGILIFGTAAAIYFKVVQILSTL